MSNKQAPDYTRVPPLTASFWALNISQFLGALNDNAFRWVMVLALIARASDPALGEVATWPLYVAGLVFALPFILFSSAAGVVADRFSKRRVIIAMNACEVLVMVLGLLAFLSNQPVLIYAVLFLMLTQSTFFSPGKFGILPEIVHRQRLSYANGLIQAFTYLAIILGTVGGTFLYKMFGAPLDLAHASTASCWGASVVCIVLASIGFCLSLFIRETGVRSSGKKVSPYFWREVERNLGECRADRYLYLTLFAIAFFLFLGAFVQLNVTPLGIETLHWSKVAAPNLFLLLAFGIGLGSYLAGRISRRVIEIGLVPVGAAMVAVASLLFLAVPLLPLPESRLDAVGGVMFGFASRDVASVLLLLVLGMGGGFYIVPLQAFLQQRAPEHDRGELIATSNFLSFCGVLLASGLLLLLDSALGLSPTFSFGVIGLITLVLTIAVVKVLPDFLVRFVGLVVTRLVYRLETYGVEHVPTEGSALLVCNHVSFVDAALIGATHQRRIRFVMAREYYDNPWLNWLFRLMQAIPIDRHGGPREMVKSLNAAREALDDGYLVCIFAEGELTRTGSIMEFRPGFERIVRGTDHPVIPLCLHGVWGSMFSHRGGKPEFRWARLRGWGRAVSVTFGTPLASETDAFEVRQAVMELQSEAFIRDKRRAHILPIEFTRAARAQWGRFCMADTLGKNLKRGEALTGAIVMRDILNEPLRGQECVGILLPTSVGAALANVAVGFLGKVPVNLNYTCSPATVREAMSACGIKTVLTSRKFLDKVGFEDLPGLLFLEDLLPRVQGRDKLRAYVQARFWPARALVKPEGAWPDVDDTAAILFSSGSTGKPKGVMLSHYNIYSNVDAVQQVFRTDASDVVCGTLPFFHSFGLTDTLWLPILGGFGVAYHPSPLEAENIGRMVRKRKCTILLSTPTFILRYARKIPSENFATIRIVITGAEKLKPRVAEMFTKHFDVEPFEGYGTTELSPVASVNMMNVEMEGIRQKAHEPGTIGRPIAGVTMRVVDPDNMEKNLGYESEGLLLVKGPNVMKGYLNDPERTEEVMHGEWYITGDMAKIRHDGFVQITDRLSRFSKIGGEMVPHLAIEEQVQEWVGKTASVCAVTSIPDERKGERIVMLLTPDAGTPEEVYRMLREESGLPNLWIPARSSIHVVEEIPILATGKMDLKSLKDLAQQKDQG